MKCQTTPHLKERCFFEDVNGFLDALVNYWLQTAVVQDETIEWMKTRLAGKKPELLIAKFGAFLEQTKPGTEPDLDEIQEAMKE